MTSFITSYFGATLSKTRATMPAFSSRGTVR